MFVYELSGCGFEFRCGHLKKIHLNSVNNASIIVRGISKKEKNLCIVLYICCYSFISNFIYIQALKKIVYSFAVIRKKKTFVQNILHPKYSVVFRKPLVKKYVNDNKSKLLFRFTTTKMDWGRCILCQKIQVLLCSNTTVCGYVNLKNNTEEFQRSEVPFRFGILVHLNELRQGDGIIQNFKKGKAKRHENCALELSASK